MSKWGTAKWGTGVLWGESTYVYPTMFWAVMVDWDGDGVVDSNDAFNRISGLTIERGRSYFLNSDGSGFQPVSAGRATITLDNEDGKYDSFNTHSPLYPNVVPGRKIEIRMVENDGTEHWIFVGYIDDIQPGSTHEEVVITAVDAMKKLNNDSVSVGVQTNITVQEAIEMVLDEAGITAYDIDGIDDTIHYWWVDQKIPSKAIQELADASLSTFFFAADGTAKCYMRNRPIGLDISLNQDQLTKDIGYKQPWKVIRNNIDIVNHPMVLNSSGTLWTLQDKPSIGVGESIEIWADFKYLNAPAAATGVVSPVTTTDFLVNTAADGSGTNLTASCVVAADIFAQSAKLTITNNSASDGYITLLKIRGQAINSPDTARINRQDTTSIGLYGKKTFKIDSEWLQDTNISADLADLIKIVLANPRKFPTIRIQTRPEVQFSIDLFDRLSLSIEALGIDFAYRVGAVKHQWLSQNGQDVLTTLTLEPVISSSEVYWVFPTEIGVSSIFGA